MVAQSAPVTALVPKARESTTAVETTRGIRIDTFDDLQRFCKAAAASGFFKDAHEIAQAIVKVQYGMEIGIPPIVAMTGIHCIEGKLSVSSGVIAGRIRASGRYDYRVVKHDAAGCTLSFVERVDGKWSELGLSTFTMEDAKAAKLAHKDVWQKYGKAMCFSRAMTQGARWFTPDIFAGPVYSPEEVSSGDVIDADAVVTSAHETAPVEAPVAVEQPEPGAKVRDAVADAKADIEAKEAAAKAERDRKMWAWTLAYLAKLDGAKSSDELLGVMDASDLETRCPKCSAARGAHCEGSNGDGKHTERTWKPAMRAIDDELVRGITAYEARTFNAFAGADPATFKLDDEDMKALAKLEERRKAASTTT